MKQLKEFIINFNRDLTVTCYKTRHQGVNIPYVDHFNVVSRLNLHHDSLKFIIKYNRVFFSGEIISINVEKQFPDNQNHLIEKLNVTQRFVKDDVFTELEINTKDILLELFSTKTRSFKLSISYVHSHKFYTTSCTVTLPIIDKQEKWSNVKSNVNPEDVVANEVDDDDDEDEDVFVQASDEMPSEQDIHAVNQKVLNEYLPQTVCPPLVTLYKSGFKLGPHWSQDVVDMDNEILSYRTASLYTKFHNFDFMEMYKRMLCLEDLSIQRTINKQYSLKNQRVTRYKASSKKYKELFHYLLRRHICHQKATEILQEAYVIEAPTKLPNDKENYGSIFVTNMVDYNKYKTCRKELRQYSFTAAIDYIFGRYIIFNAKHHTIPTDAISNQSLYHVSFCPNRMTIRTAQRALETLQDNELSVYLKDFDLPNCPNNNRDTDLKFYHLNWRNQKIINNEEQKQAVENIVNETAFPAPYLVIGPPGTGKTTTIIESIAQILHLKPNARILLTSNTNANCDELGVRLLEYVSCNKVLRIYSTRVDESLDKIPPVLKPISNYRLEQSCYCQLSTCKHKHPYDNPSYEEFYTARVVIATLCSSGRFVTAGIQSNHFDYIFIDEAASNSEQYTYIPIAGLGSKFQQITANIIMCGDPTQLGPIVSDKFNKGLQMDISMIERLMMMEKYQYGSTAEIRASNPYITQLVNNFRSNFHILRFSNQKFYNSQLKSMLPDETANFAVNWHLLQNRRIPILMHPTFKECFHVGTSLINDGEVAIVNYYVNTLLGLGINGQKVYQDDIGIISPYRAQRENMNLIFKTYFPNIEIGTIDSFQGREKKIIIISTVRSRNLTAGFLADERRINVALTRAQCLLIVVGNPDTLSQCEVWSDFIDFCGSLNAIVKHPNDFEIMDTYYDTIKESVRQCRNR